jgi:hypothetical protein
MLGAAMTFLFIVAAIIVGLVVFFGMLDAEVMPLSCPACHAGADANIAGVRRPWYVVERSGRVRCRACYARFRESPDGTLAEERDA